MRLKHKLAHICLILLVLVFTNNSYAKQVDAVKETVEFIEFSQALTALKESSLSQRGKAIEHLATFKHPQTIVIFEALLKGNLLETRNAGQIVVAEKNASIYNIFAAENGESLGSVERSATKKITVTNRLRSQLKILIAQLKLNSEDPKIRLKAVKAMAKTPDKQALQLLAGLAETETNQNVQKVLQLVFVLQELDSSDHALRVAAIEALQEARQLASFKPSQNINRKRCTRRVFRTQ